ncbi:MAG: hypothetical protein DDT33_01665 [Firmicutes bacterium]|nr:hypothetical protein [Bacillota bacterium]
MSNNDRQSGGCRICGDRCEGYKMICPICLQWVLEKAASAETVGEALEIIKGWLLE